MGNITNEQKARAYDEAIKVIKDNLDALNEITETGAEAVNIQAIKNCFYRAFPELKESEDENIRKEIIKLVKFYYGSSLALKHTVSENEMIDWLEKQGEHANFRNKIQVGDKVTRNEDGVLVNMSQLKRVAKPADKQGEQKPVKNIVEIWKDMRLEVYQQASGNRHEPNCSDDTTKIFSINDIDEIVEKMSEQSSTDKAGPKFKVGDWVVDKNGIVKQILSYKDCIYKHTDGYSSKMFEDEWRLWDITKDAKDGDVVVDKSDGAIGIFQSIGHHPDGGSYNDPSYCFLHCRYDSGFFYADFERGNTIDSGDLVPATKEQRDTLMKAMADAGYTFDFEKKELKKIEQEHTPKHKVGDTIYYNSFGEVKSMIVANVITDGTNNPMYEDENGSAVFEEDLIEQKPVEWSEEDKKMFVNIKACLRSAIKNYSAELDWLKSLKDRVQPNCTEWDEEDEKYSSFICAALQGYYRLRENENNTNGQENLDKARNWLYNRLKSFKPQKQWKPSEDQMDMLKIAVSTSNSIVLGSLYDDLKKLHDGRF